MIHPFPYDATHEWTPAVIEFPWFQRKYYKKVNDEWYSFSYLEEWLPSNNTPEWFEEETRLGYFVPLTGDKDAR